MAVKGKLILLKRIIVSALLSLAFFSPASGQTADQKTGGVKLPLALGEGRISNAPSSPTLFLMGQGKMSQEDRTRNDLMQLERDIGKANIENDYAFFDRVEAEEFTFTDAGGGVTTRKQDLEGLKQPANPDVKLVAYDVDEMKVMLYDKTAVVTGRVTTKRMVKGAEVVSKSRFTDVFVWRQERWQLVAGHSSRIRNP